MVNGIRRSVNADNEAMQHVFCEEMDQLLLLAYLLTGQHEQAVECFLETWEVSSEQPPSPPRHALHVAKSAIVKAAIRRITADVTRCAAEGGEGGSTATTAYVLSSPEEAESSLNAGAFQQAFLTLNAFHRAALVLRLYEGYSSADAALLLRVSRQALENGWQQALIALLGQLKLMSAGSRRVAEPVLVLTSPSASR